MTGEHLSGMVGEFPEVSISPWSDVWNQGVGPSSFPALVPPLLPLVYCVFLVEFLRLSAYTSDLSSARSDQGGVLARTHMASVDTVL